MTTDTYYFLVIIVVLIAVAAVLFVWLRRDRTLPGAGADVTTTAPRADTAPDRQVTAAEVLVDPIAPIFPEAVGAERPTTTIAEDAPAPTPVEAGPPDPLTTLKGLGPKAAARLNELGITRYDQLAALSAGEAGRVDSQMGAFQGRMLRDRWIEQAGHLATGDVAGFEAKFGKIGG